MNAITFKVTADGTGVDMDLVTNPTDTTAAFFVQWLYDQIVKTETLLPDVEAPQWK